MYRTYASPRIITYSAVQHQFSEHVETTASSELNCSCSYIHETCRAYSSCTPSIALASNQLPYQLQGCNTGV